MPVKETDEWKKRVVELFMLRSPPNRLYKALSGDEILSWFGRYDGDKLKEAFESLINDKVIIQSSSGEKRFYQLNLWEKSAEIRNLIRREPFAERAARVKPNAVYFNGLKEMFTRATERAWPNRGTYYYCIKEDDTDYWLVLIKTKPTITKPDRIVLGSLKERDSKISKMWRVVIKVWKKNDKEPIWKKMAEDEDQTIFGNNRQPSTCAFQLFEHLKWIKEIGKKGNKMLYQIIDEDGWEKYQKA